MKNPTQNAVSARAASPGAAFTASDRFIRLAILIILAAILLPLCAAFRENARGAGFRAELSAEAPQTASRYDAEPVSGVTIDNQATFAYYLR